MPVQKKSGNSLKAPHIIVNWLLINQKKSKQTPFPRRDESLMMSANSYLGMSC